MHRRRDDWKISLVDEAGEGSITTEGAGVCALPGDERLVSAALAVASEEPSPVVLVRANLEERDLVVAGPSMPVAGTEIDSAEAEVALAMWRQNWLRIWRRSEIPGKLLRFFEELSDAETAEEVCEVVSSNALRIVGGYDAAVLLVDPALEPEVGAPETLLYEGSRFTRAGMIHGNELAMMMGGALGGLAVAEGLSHVVHVPLGRSGVLFLSERRSDRIFEADDWEVLVALGEQGERALQRVWKLEKAEALSLTDPLTGLANRRQMDVVMTYAWAAAQRGDGLAVIMIDLNDFKGINDSHGHRAGDQILQIVADSLKSEARGADAVVRYGGDEFLVIMPRGDEEGARALINRVRKRLSGWVSFTAGVSTYQLSQQSPVDLIQQADEALYLDRDRQRRLNPGAGPTLPSGQAV